MCFCYTRTYVAPKTSATFPVTTSHVMVNVVKFLFEIVTAKSQNYTIGITGMLVYNVVVICVLN